MPGASEPSAWLSVVTVVKDAPTDFNATVASLASQDPDGVEYLVVDSSIDHDATLRSLDSLPPMRVACSHTPPRGIYPAMNDALDRATGEYVYFLNAGDVLHAADVLTRVRVELMSRDSLWAFGDVQIRQRDGRVVVTPPWDYAAEKAVSFSRGHFPPHQGTFVRSDLLRAQGGFDPSYSIVADYAAFLRISAVADPLRLDLVIADFTEGGVSTNRWPESLLQFHRARREILRPTGFRAARELGETVKQAAAMGLYRGVISKFGRA